VVNESNLTNIQIAEYAGIYNINMVKNSKLYLNTVYNSIIRNSFKLSILNIPKQKVLNCIKLTTGYKTFNEYWNCHIDISTVFNNNNIKDREFILDVSQNSLNYIAKYVK
jgi:mRNA-degrading endonuclease HigB of HigAB toxin-antitoxin module